MTTLLDATAIGILAIILPVAALANVTGTQKLTTGQTLSLDTGVAGTSGGDILWTAGTGISMQGNATELNLTAASSYSGASSLSLLDAAQLTQFGSYSSAPLPLSALAVNNIFAVLTNYGNYAAVLVTAQSGSSITLQFITFAGAAPTQPKITAVLNNYGLIPAGFTNSGIAPGTLFIIQGYGLASTTSVSSLEPSTLGSVLPTTLNGASVTVTVGGTTATPAFYYAENTQLALVMPSGTPVGGTSLATFLTVTYNGQTSAPFYFNVVAAAPGLAAYYGTGSGLAHSQDLDYIYYNYGNSIPPGSTIRLIGSGLGADPNPARDTQYVIPSTADAINALANVYVGGIDAVIVYQGPEGYPGLDEIDITIPANTPTGCFISVVGVTAGGVPTNFLTLPIGTGECRDSLGYAGNTISSLIGNTTVNFGSVSIIDSPPPAGSPGGTQSLTEVSADFFSESGSAFGTSSGLVSVGSCIAGESLSSNTTSSTIPLNAGTITVNDPNGVAAVTLISEGSGQYGVQLPTGFLTQAGGAFPITATAGTPAPAVGAFNTSVNFPTPFLSWTNQAADATVVRSQGVVVNWSGGEPDTYVLITGTSSSGSASSYFACFAPVATGTFTVPPYVLATLPASTGGSLEVANQTAGQTFTATGLDYGYAIGEVGYNINTTYQ
jgi:uncharacterized protein (TIGR03437 family)